jgi:hypothetical protein
MTARYRSARPAVLAALVAGLTGGPFDRAAARPNETLVVYAAVRIDFNNPFPAAEPSIAASKLNPAEVVSAAFEFGDDTRNIIDLGYAVSLNNAFAFVADAKIPRPIGSDPGLYYSNDPSVATSPVTGEFWICGFEGTQHPRAVYVVRKASGTATLAGSPCAPIGPCATIVNSAFGPNGTENDKPWIAAGPEGAAGTILYVLWVRQDGPLGHPRMYISVSQNSGATWSAEHRVLTLAEPDLRAMAPAPIVTPDGTLVVSYLKGFRDGLSAGQIMCIASTDLGLTWSNPVGVSAVSAMLGSVRSVPGTFIVSSFPSIACDASTGALYVVWSAIVGGTNPNRDVDVFVARGSVSDGVPSFPPGDRKQIALPHDQFHPAVTVDGMGGIDLIWDDTRYTTQHDEFGDEDDAFVAQLDITFARYATWSAAPSLRRLTPASFPSWTALTNIVSQFLGDYQGIAASGCWIYPDYVRIVGTTQHHYTNPIYIIACGGADFNASGSVDTADAADYLSAYAAGEPTADLDGDGAVQTPDLVEFLAAYGGG